MASHGVTWRYMVSHGLTWYYLVSQQYSILALYHNVVTSIFFPGKECSEIVDGSIPLNHSSHKHL